jgi:sodium/proline symporter
MDSNTGLLLSFGAFLALFLGIGGIAARRGTGSESDYLLGGRGYGRWMVGLSAGATGNSTFMLIAVVGIGYTQGLGVVAMILGFAIGELFFWTYFSEPISLATDETGAETVAQLVAHRLTGPGAQRVRSIVSVLIFVFVGAYLAAQLAGSATILEVFFGIRLPAGVILALLAILAYCTTGGLRASIWTDIAQAVVMLGMAVGVLLSALIDVGGPAALVAGLKQADPSLLSPMHGYTVGGFAGTVLGFTGIGAGFGLSQPHVTVRLMAGRDAQEVKKARWIYMGFVYVVFCAMAGFGICCRLLLPDIADPEQSLPTYAMARFDPWLVGVVLAGMFSTIASSADSQILACSSAISRDFSPRFDARMTARFGIRYQYAATALTGLLAAAVAIGSSSTVFEVVIFSLSVLSASVGAGMLITVLRRPTSSEAMSLAMLTGVGTALLWRYCGFHLILSDVVPGLLAALLTHEIVARIRPGESSQEQPCQGSAGTRSSER